MISGEGGNVAVLRDGRGRRARRRHVRPQPRRHPRADQVGHRQAAALRHQHASARRPRRRRHEDAADRGSDRAQERPRQPSHIKQPYYEDTPGTPIGLPRITFSDETSVFLGGKEVRAKYFGRGHTNGDAVDLLPGAQGDPHRRSVSRTTGRSAGAAAPARTRPPGVNIYVDYAQGGSFLDWTKTLDGVLHARLRHRHSRARSGLDERRRREVSSRPRDDAEPAGRHDQVRRRARATCVKTLEDDYGWRSTGCPLTRRHAGCLQFQQIDALIAELK